MTAYQVQQLQSPGSVAGHAPTLSSPSQYTAKLERELQKLRVGVEDLDLLSPAGRRDLEALQSSGLGSIHYPGYLAQVSGALRPDYGERRGPQRSWGSPWPCSVFPRLPHTSLCGVPQPCAPGLSWYAPQHQRTVVNEPPPIAYVTIHGPEP